MKTYGQVHAGLHYFRGPARDHMCACGKPAQEWAYLHTDGPLEVVDDIGRVYSLDLQQYEAMCKPCHKKFDEPRRNTAKAKEMAARNLADWRHRVGTDPKAAARMASAWKRGAETVRSLMASDPEYDAHIRSARRTAGILAGKVRKRCGGCTLISTPGPLARHQRSSGHRGQHDA